MDPSYALSCLLVSGFTSDFQFYDHYTIPVHILLYHLCSIPPVSCSYLIIPRVFPGWYQLLYIYLLLHACAYDTVYNAYLWLGFIDTHVLISTGHLAFTSPLAWSSDASRSSCPGFRAWSVWILPVGDLQKASVIARRPLWIQHTMAGVGTCFDEDFCEAFHLEL